MILVTYHTVTGNTRKVAEAIHQVIPHALLLPLSDVPSSATFDLIFAGFPIMQFRPPREIITFLAGIPEEQKLALFVTHAMSSGNEDDATKKMLGSILDKCRKAAPQADLKGFFDCRGELAEQTAGMLAASGIPLLMKFAGMRKETIGHPDIQELQEAGLFARSIIAGLK